MRCTLGAGRCTLYGKKILRNSAVFSGSPTIYNRHLTGRRGLIRSVRDLRAFVMVVLNPNNWHWVDKNTLPWSKDFFNDNLSNLGVVSEDGKHRITLTSVSNVAGDSNVSQRKGKPICYYDLQLTLAVSVVELENEKEVSSGSIYIPEFMHDEDDFEVQYQNLDSFQGLIAAEFYPRVREVLLKYQPALIGEHSKDLKDNN